MHACMHIHTGVSALGESGLLAGLLAGGLTVAAHGNGIAALAAGIASGHICRKALATSHWLGLPATASTLITVGGSGFVGGVVGGALGTICVPLAGKHACTRAYAQAS